MTLKIYVASSWRNLDLQQRVVVSLRMCGYAVYDFTNPEEGSVGFHWSAIDPNWQNWTNEQYIKALNHPISEAGYKADMDAMEAAHVCVLVQPCGRSAHLELAWFVGKGKKTCMLLPPPSEGIEPELMAKMCDHISLDIEDLIEWLELP